MDTSTLHVRVGYAVVGGGSGGDRVAHHMSKKKRTSALDILRPKSRRALPTSTIQDPVPSSAGSLRLRTPLKPRDGLENVVEGRILRNGANGETGDFAVASNTTLRHTKSIPQLSSTAPGRPSSSRGGRGRIKGVDGLEWHDGLLELNLKGSAGVEGGSLTLRGSSSIILEEVLPPRRARIEAAVPSLRIRAIHPSLLSHPSPHTLLLQSNSILAASSPAVGSEPRTARPSTSSSSSTSTSRPFGILRRSRGVTVSTPPASASASSHQERMERLRNVTGSARFEEVSGSSTRSGTTIGTVSLPSETLSVVHPSHDGGPAAIYVSFAERSDFDEWSTLLQALFDPRADRTIRTLRRLSIKVFDLHEVVSPLQAPPGGGAACPRDEDRSVRSAGAAGSQNLSNATKAAGRSVKPGWARRDRLRLEVIIDGTVMARTSWQGAQDLTATGPFWGETLAFPLLDAVNSCCLRLYRQHRSLHSLLIGSISLPLVPSFTRSRDERYPIFASDGEMVGEARLAVKYHEIVVLRPEGYAGLVQALDGKQGAQTILTLAAQASGSLDGTTDMFTRIGLALGRTGVILRELCATEAIGNRTTLFRANTPFTQVMESHLRLLSRDFLDRSIGSTIDHILKKEIALQVVGKDSLPDVDARAAMLDLARRCWSDTYESRGAFPALLRPVLRQLMTRVRKAHGDEQTSAGTVSLLPYKAASSFVFLRLICPALVRPHLFGLAPGLATPGVQHTLTLLAKIIHALAFFGGGEDARDPEVALFAGFCTENREMMLDYLSSLATHDPERGPDHSVHQTTSYSVLAGLRAHSPLNVPHLTPAGPVDLCGELALLAETLFEHRGLAHRLPAATRGLEELDRVLVEVHRAAYFPASSPNHTIAKLPEASPIPKGLSWVDSATNEDRSGKPPRPSLSISPPPPAPPAHPSRPSLRERVSSPTTATWRWLTTAFRSPTHPSSASARGKLRAEQGMSQSVPTSPMPPIAGAFDALAKT